MQAENKKPSKLKGVPLVPKYKDPATGKTWAGRGKKPKWVIGEKEAYLINKELYTL